MKFIKSCIFLLLGFATIARADLIAIIIDARVCSTEPALVHQYLKKLTMAGYDPVKICTQPVSVQVLKNKLIAETKKRALGIESISGINVFGPVVTTTLSAHLRSFRKHGLPATALLAFDYMSFKIDEKDQLTNIENILSISYAQRWVSHIGYEIDKNQSQDVITRSIVREMQLLVDSPSYPAAFMSSYGEYYFRQTAEDMFRTKNVDLLPDSNVLLLNVVSLVGHVAAGLGRVHSGWSYFNRFEEPKDLIGTTILNSLLILCLFPNEIFIEVLRQAQGNNNQIYSTLPELSKWMKVAANAVLQKDGLSKCPERAL